MKKLHMLRKVFFTKKSLLLLLLNSTLKFAIVFLIIIFTLAPILNYHFSTDAYQYAKFDAIVSDCSVYTFNKFKSDPNITGLVGISGPLLGTSISKGKNQVNGKAVAVYDNNFDALREYILTDKLFIKKDEKLMKRDNAMLLSYSYMLELNANIGDVITLDGENFEYVLAGVFSESVSWTSMAGVSIIVLGDAHNGALLDFMDEILGSRLYGTVYLSFKDKVTGLNEINESYYRDFGLYKKYGENYLEDATEDELFLAKGGAKVRTKQLRNLQLSFKYSESAYDKSYAFFIIPIGMIMISLLTIQENNKKIQLGLKPISILCISGISRKYIFSYFLLDSFITMSLLQVLAIYLSNLFFRSQELYAPNSMLIKYAILFILSILFASAISSSISLKKIGEGQIMAALNDEDIQEDLL